MTRILSGRSGYGWPIEHDGECVSVITVAPDVKITGIWPRSTKGVGLITDVEAVFDGDTLRAKSKMDWVDVTKECTFPIYESEGFSVIEARHSGNLLGHFGTEGFQKAICEAEEKQYTIETGREWTQNDGNVRVNRWFKVMHYQEVK